MTSPLEGSIAAAIYSGMKGLFLDATLVRDVQGSASPAAADYDPHPFTQASYPCKAIAEIYSETTQAAGYATQSDRKVIILTNSLSVTPKPGDRVTIRSRTYTVLEVNADPALATWTCKAKI